VDNADLVARLTSLGLTTYEARAYGTLVRRDSFSAAQVAREAGLPRQRIYDVLGSLVQKGLASARPGPQVKYTAIAPELAVERLLSESRRRLSNLELAGTSIVDALTPVFEAGKSHTDPLEYIEVLRDRGAINERFAELQAQVKDEILVFTKPPYATPPQENVEGIEVTRTHEARSVYETSVFDDPLATDGVRRFVDAGEQARFVDRLPLKLVIIDESIVMFGMEDPVEASTALTIVVVEHRSLAQILKVAFNTVWDTGLTFDAAYDRYVTRRTRSA
jgi:HTH-type transcriptional regulator, sugar sensing transcriptional regulator